VFLRAARPDMTGPYTLTAGFPVGGGVVTGDNSWMDALQGYGSDDDLLVCIH
jgi:hypothetical protein